MSTSPEGREGDYSPDFVGEGDDDDESKVLTLSEEIDPSAVSVSLSFMSTIQEEMSEQVREEEQERNVSRVPEELQGLTCQLEGSQQEEGEGEGEEASVSVSSQGQTLAESEECEEGVEELLKKLELLQNTQNLLEQVLDGGADMAEEDMERALQLAIANLPTTSKGNRKDKGHDLNASLASADEDLLLDEQSASISLSQEMSALQRLINSASGPSPIEKSDREVSEVLKEYEDLERVLAAQSAEIAKDHRHHDHTQVETSFSSAGEPPLESNNPTFPWRDNRDQEEAFFEGEERTRTTPTFHDKYIDHIHNTPAHFPYPFDEEEDMDEDRSMTKTVKRKIPVPTKSPSSPLLATNTGTPKPTTVTRPFSSPGLKRPSPSNQNAKGSQSAVTVAIHQSPKQRPTSAGFRGNRTPVKDPFFLRPTSSGASGDDHGHGHTQAADELLDLKEKMARLQDEMQRQESLLQAYQDDNQRLYTQLKEKEGQGREQEGEWESLVSSLKTEIATLKIQRLAANASPTKKKRDSQEFSEREKELGAILKEKEGEIAQIRKEGQEKALQVTELRKEIATLKKNLAESEGISSFKSGIKDGKWAEKEKDYQKQIRDLSKQVRRLQKILYGRDPEGAALLSAATTPRRKSTADVSVSAGDNRSEEALILGARVAELESQLALTDEDAKARLKDFSHRLITLKNKYEDQIQQYEVQLAETTAKMAELEASSSTEAISELETRLDRSAGEITCLKTEISRLKRELEISQREKVNQPSKQDQGTLTLALKSFKVELAEKEREIVRLKKEVGEVSKTNASLKREREKYLSGQGSVHTPNLGNIQGQSQSHSRSRPTNLHFATKSKSAIGITTPSATSSQVDRLENALEYEREEFGRMVARQKKDIQEKEKTIQTLRTKLEELELSLRTPSDTTAEETVLNELRSRVRTQNELILRLKEHLGSLKSLQSQVEALQKERDSANRKVKELQEQLEISQALTRPENEILAVLASKFDELNRRYLEREAQMELLLSKLSLNTVGPSSSSSSSNANNLKGLELGLLLASSSSSSPGSSPSPDLDLRTLQLSPTLTARLFGINH